MNSASIFKTEWLKIRHYTPYWIILAVYTLCVGGAVAVVLRLQTWFVEQASHRGAEAMDSVNHHAPFDYPHCWQTVAWLASFLQFIPALLMILNVTNEFTFRSHRQNLLEGWSRGQFLVSKLGLGLALTLYCSLNVVVLAVLAATFGRFTPSPEGLEYVLIFMLQTFFYTTLALLLAFFIKRAALALAAFLVYTVVLENIASVFIGFKVDNVAPYLPLHSVNSLLPMPFQEEAAKTIHGLVQAPREYLAAAALLYLGGMIALTWAKFRNEDL